MSVEKEKPVEDLSNEELLNKWYSDKNLYSHPALWYSRENSNEPNYYGEIIKRMRKGGYK